MQNLMQNMQMSKHWLRPGYLKEAVMKPRCLIFESIKTKTPEKLVGMEKKRETMQASFGGRELEKENQRIVAGLS